ncbi:MAG: hypothetical protein LUE27_11030 [Clostridia bacterium]|nr:hypothetical protein [Clostridia bacterium]
MRRWEQFTDMELMKINLGLTEEADYFKQSGRTDSMAIILIDEIKKEQQLRKAYATAEPVAESFYPVRNKVKNVGRRKNGGELA